ncbi:MAG: RluA family pseudouridine synthase [Candidatus Gracilibacteria bacterium]|nr:RluA family pseudouridine synthase [Candidatus Gracilibacteria bacterium]
MKIKFCTLIEDKKRVDMYLSVLFKDFSRSYIQKIIDKGEVSINGKIISKNLKIKNKDLIEIDIKVEKNEKVEAEDLNLDVVFEDENIIIINKEAGINTHPVPGEGGNSNTLVNGVLFHCKEKLPVISGEERPGIVHRLDKDTSGAIMIAKNDKMMHYLQTLFKERKNISKYYLAIVHGVVKSKDFTIESYIGRDPNNRLKMTTVNSINPKIAISHGEVLGYIQNKFTLVRIKIETGRTHQIRVHMASIGHFILGDTTYGNPKINIECKTRYQLKRQALHAYNLKLKLYEKKMKVLLLH